jgi:manganese-dependent inorganic pyrophosphatase
MVVDDKDKLIGVFSKTDLIKPVDTEIILVDHNELTQAISGANQVKILEIIDHHRLGNNPSDQPILFINRPVGSSCTIIADMFRTDGITPSPEIAGIMMSGIISDTLKLKGPTSTPVDEEILNWLSGIACQDIDELANLIFNSGSVLINMEPEEAIRVDCKLFEESGWHFSAAQIEELGMDNFTKNSEALYTALQKYRMTENVSMSALLVTDINTQNSILLVSGEDEILDAIEYEILIPNKMYNLPGIVSRKKQLIPYLSTLFKKLAKPVES